jgi:hypothetical protein
MNEILAALVMFSILSLIGIFLLKLYNILYACQVYGWQSSITTFAVGIIAYFFIEIGLFLNLTVEFNVYMWMARVFVLMIAFSWFVELIIYAMFHAVEPLERMAKRRTDRLSGSSGSGQKPRV